MKNILLIATGGTIASRTTEQGLAPSITSEDLLGYVPEIASLCRVDTVQLFNLDSTNICKKHWTRMAECVRSHYEEYDGFVITHGTDTMAYTSAALSYLIRDNRKPVVITGSQKSIYLQDSDARRNLTDAFTFACDDRASGVHIVFNGQAIIGTRAKKTRTKSYNAFSCMDYPETALIREKNVLFYIRDSIEAETPSFDSKMSDRVFLLKLIPGIRADIFAYLKPRYDALVIESFGVGGIPFYETEEFSEAIADWVSSGKFIVITTQVPHEGSDMEVYRVGCVVKEKYELMEAYNMTAEAVVTKLMWILAKTKDDSEVRRLFYTPIAKDILL